MELETAYNKDSFVERVYRKSKSLASKNGVRYALSRFDQFCLDKFNRSSEEIARSIKDGKLDVYRVLDSFIEYLHSLNITGGSIQTYTTWVRKFLIYLDVDISELKFREKVDMPKHIRRKDAELTRENINRILQNLPLKLRLVCMLDHTH